MNMVTSWIPIVFFLFVIIGVVSYFFTVYNGLIQVKENIKKAWANIDVLLKQRHDELPKLIKVCEHQMKYEQETLEKVIQARNVYTHAETIGQKAEANNMLTGALGHLFAVAEQYPDLKANQGFAQLHQRIIGLEEKIADRREFYNETVNSFNIRIQQLPDVFIARMLSYQPEEMFKVEEQDKQDVEIDIKFPE